MAPSYSGRWIPIFWRDLGHQFYPEVRGTWQYIPEDINYSFLWRQHQLHLDSEDGCTWHNIPERSSIHLEGALNFTLPWRWLPPHKTRWYNLVDHNPIQVWCLDSVLLFITLQLYWRFFDKYIFLSVVLFCKWTIASHNFIFQLYNCQTKEFLKLLHDAYAMT
jgi:hypothetical protein